MNIDVEIYLKNFLSFFDSNPEELIKLIGGSSKEIFYEKIKEVSYKNFESIGDMVLTKSQIIDIAINIFNQTIPKHSQETKVGKIFLN